MYRVVHLPFLHKHVKLNAEAAILWQTRRIRFQHTRQHLEVRVAALVRIGAGGQLDQRDAQRPNVRADVVFGFVQVDAFGLSGQRRRQYIY